MRYGLARILLWIGALKFKGYEVENAEPPVTASPLTARLREKLGAQKLRRLVVVLPELSGCSVTVGLGSPIRRRAFH